MSGRKRPSSLLRKINDRWKSDSNLLQNYTDTQDSFNRSLSVSNLNNDHNNNVEAIRLIESMRYHISQLKSELLHEQNVNKNLKREAVLNAQNIREEESTKFQRLLKVAEFKLQKNYDLELQKECDYLKKGFTLEMNLMKKTHEEVLNCKRKLWLQEKDQIVLQSEKSKINVKNELLEDFNQIRQNYEKEIFELKETIQNLNNELIVFKDKDFNRVDENRLVYEIHQEELKKLKKEAEKSSKKQFSEIKKLNKYIEKLEKKSGHDTTIHKIERDQYLLSPETIIGDFSPKMVLEKSQHNKNDDYFDIEGYIMEMPAILATKPHNDPERILHRKYVELCTLVRKLDEKNQQIAISNQELLNDLTDLKKQYKPLEDKLVQLGKKNMDLSHIVRKYENKIKELQKDLSVKDEKLIHLQEMVQKKEKKMQKFKKNEELKVKAEDFEDLQRQFCDQLQIISELRQQNINKDMQIEYLKRRKHNNLKEKRSLSLQSLDSLEVDVESDEEQLLFGNEKEQTTNILKINENEESKHQLAILSKEHLKLQHTYNLLQQQMVESMDPERVELNREALKSDLLLSQAVINGLEKRVEELEKNHICWCTTKEDSISIEKDYKKMEEEKNEFRHKLISAESDLVQKSIQLNAVTEDLREALDHNELLEFQIAEMEHSHKLKKRQVQPLLSFIDEDKDDFYLESIKDIECNAISVRIALKEMQINRGTDLSTQELKTLSQARALIDRGTKDINELKESDKNLKIKMVEIVNMYNDAKLRLSSKEEELSKLLNEKSIAEEKELLTYKLGKSKKKLELTFGLEKSEPLSEARLKIAELELKNELLKNRVACLGDQQADLTAEEINLLQQKVVQHQKCDEQISLMKASYDELLKKLNQSEEQKNLCRTSGNSIYIPLKLSQEIEKLKEENKDLSKEVGLLRSKTNDALFLAQQTKNALSKEEQATQTPVFEYSDFRLLEVPAFEDFSKNTILENELSFDTSEKQTQVNIICRENFNQTTPRIWSPTKNNFNQTTQTDFHSPIMKDDFNQTTPRNLSWSPIMKDEFNQTTPRDVQGPFSIKNDSNKKTQTDLSQLPIMKDDFNQTTPREVGRISITKNPNQSTQTDRSRPSTARDEFNQTTPSILHQIEPEYFYEQVAFQDETSRRSSKSHVEDLKKLKNTVDEELMKVVVLNDLSYDPMVFLNDDFMYPSDFSGNNEPASVLETPFVGDNQLLIDNEFIQSILKDYTVQINGKKNSGDVGDNLLNEKMYECHIVEENVKELNMPVLMQANLRMEDTLEKPSAMYWSELKKDYNSMSGFHVYLNESLKQQQSTPRNNPLISNRSTLSYSISTSRESNSSQSNQSGTQTSGDSSSDFKLKNEIQFSPVFESADSGSWVSNQRSSESTSSMINSHHFHSNRVDSNCSTCGITPPNNRGLPPEVMNDLNAYAVVLSTSTSSDVCGNSSDSSAQSSDNLAHTHFEIHDSVFKNPMKFDNASLKAENLFMFERNEENLSIFERNEENLLVAEKKERYLKESFSSNENCKVEDSFSPSYSLPFFTNVCTGTSLSNYKTKSRSPPINKELRSMKKKFSDKITRKKPYMSDEVDNDVKALLDYGEILSRQGLPTLQSDKQLQEQFSHVCVVDVPLLSTCTKPSSTLENLSGVNNFSTKTLTEMSLVSSSISLKDDAKNELNIKKDDIVTEVKESKLVQTPDKFLPDATNLICSHSSQKSQDLMQLSLSIDIKPNPLNPYSYCPSGMLQSGSSQHDAISTELKPVESRIEKMILSCCPNSYTYLRTFGTVSSNAKHDSYFSPKSDSNKNSYTYLRTFGTVSSNAKHDSYFSPKSNSDKKSESLTDNFTSIQFAKERLEPVGYSNAVKEENKDGCLPHADIRSDIMLHNNNIFSLDIIQKEVGNKNDNFINTINHNHSLNDAEVVANSLCEVRSVDSKNREIDGDNSINSCLCSQMIDSFSQSDIVSQNSVPASKNNLASFINLPCPILSKPVTPIAKLDLEKPAYADGTEENTMLVLPKILANNSSQLKQQYFLSRESIDSSNSSKKRARSVCSFNFDSVKSLKKNRSRSHSPVKHNLSTGQFVEREFFFPKRFNAKAEIDTSDSDDEYFKNKLKKEKNKEQLNRNYPNVQMNNFTLKGNLQKMAVNRFSYFDDLASLRKKIIFINAEKESLERQLKYKENVIQSMQDELKEENENIILVEKKDKEIHLKSETISQLTQILERTKKELQVKSVECQRQEITIKQLRDELKGVVLEKKDIETKLNSQQVYLAKFEACETQLAQLTAKYEESCIHNHELIERVKNLEIGEKEFIDLERNLIELQVQLRDMEDVELHRDELLQKLNFVKKQRDEFLEKGRIVEEERNEFVRSNKTLEQYIIEWKKKTSDFKRTNQALKDRILNLERDKKELEERVIDVQTERSQTLGALNKIEVERDDLYRQLREITAERNSAEARLADLEDYLSDHDHLEEGFHSLRLKVSELTRQRDDAEMLIPSYKVKVQTLKKKLREKEDSIMQLTHDIKKLTIAIENQTYIDLKEIKSIDNQAHDPTKYRHGKVRPQVRGIVNYFSDSPSKHLNPSSSGESYEEILLQPNDTYSDESYAEYSIRSLHRKPKQYIALFNYEPKRHRELRLTKGDLVEVYGDVDTDGFYYAEVNGVRGLIPSVYVEDVIEDESSVHFYHGDHSPRRQSHNTNVRERKFVALYDYDPFTMGTTDRPDLQLSLTKGDEIIVIGDIDVDGYYTALKKGVRYLVPSNFVKEISSLRPEQNHIHNGMVGKSSVSDLQTSSHNNNTLLSKNHKNSNSSQTFKGLIEVDEVVGPPYAPEDLKVHRVVTKHAVLLGWKLPIMNEFGQSNRCRVIGYRIWVNGKPKQDVKSATVTKALIEGLDLHGRVEFSIQTIGDNGFCSEKCHFAITGALSALTKDNELLHQQNGDVYVALYDYDPFKSSPNPNPSLELKLSEGDLIKVTDKTRNDGFYFGEIRGNKGLVPSNFIERVTVSSGHHAHEYDSQNRRVQFERESIK